MPFLLSYVEEVDDRVGPSSPGNYSLVVQPTYSGY